VGREIHHKPKASQREARGGRGKMPGMTISQVVVVSRVEHRAA
jgi:hypothetical protein